MRWTASVAPAHKFLHPPCAGKFRRASILLEYQTDQSRPPATRSPARPSPPVAAAVSTAPLTARAADIRVHLITARQAGLVIRRPRRQPDMVMCRAHYYPPPAIVVAPEPYYVPRPVYVYPRYGAYPRYPVHAYGPYVARSYGHYRGWGPGRRW
jgi:hypothetical protein